MELSIDHAREVMHRKVEAVAELMGLESHWNIYKWMQNGGMPTRYIRAFEHACGINLLTRWLAASTGHLMIAAPTGRTATPQDMQALQELLHAAAGQLMQFYSGKSAADTVLASIQQGMEGLAWHKGNVEKSVQPEFEFTEE